MKKEDLAARHRQCVKPDQVRPRHGKKSSTLPSEIMAHSRSHSSCRQFLPPTMPDVCMQSATPFFFQVIAHARASVVPPGNTPACPSKVLLLSPRE